MKKLFNLNLLVALAVVFASCATNNNVVNNRLISKRKYNKGFHINRKGNMKSSNTEKEEESVAYEDVKSKNTKTKKATYSSTRKADSKADAVVSNENVSSDREVIKQEAKQQKALRSADGFSGDEEMSYEDFQSMEDFESDNDDNSSEKQLTKKQAKKLAKIKSRAAGGNSDLVNIILIVLLVLVILALISLIGGTLGWILSVVVLVIIIYFLLKLLGVI